MSEKDYPDFMDLPLEYQTDEEYRRWVNSWSVYAECQELKRMMRENDRPE